MSKETETQPETTEQPITLEYSLPVFVQFMAEFAKSGQEPITIPEDAELSDGSITVEVNDDFSEMFSKAFPTKSLDDALQEMLEVVIDGYIEEHKDELVGSDS